MARWRFFNSHNPFVAVEASSHDGSAQEALQREPNLVVKEPAHLGSNSNGAIIRSARTAAEDFFFQS